MGGYLLALSIVAFGLSYSKKKGWDRDCLIGGVLCLVAGVVMLANGA